jgi:DNA repair exonuclease SbcCD ATPase subunit
MSKSIQQPVELQAQAIEVGEIQNRINQIEGDIKALQVEHGKVLRGGHDIFQPGLPLDFVKKVTRDYPTDATTKAAADFELEHIRPLRQQLADLKAKLSAEQVVLGQLRVEFKVDNAERLLEQTIERLAEAASDLSNAKAHHASLEQRLSAARMGLLEADRLKTEHSVAAAQALLDGLDVPVLALPPLEEVGPLQSALTLSRERVSSLGDDWATVNAEVQHLKGLISNRKVTEFMTQLKAQASEAGVDLKAVRDKLVDEVGKTLLHLMDADELARLRFEVSTLRPEAEKLRADVKTLQNGITKLAEQRRYA